MDNQSPEISQTPPLEPINLPSPQPEVKKFVPRKSDDIVISMTTLNYAIIAILFFALGFALSWIVFNMRGDDIRTTASNAAREAVTTAIADLSAGGGGAPAATPTSIPRQTISVSPSMPAWGPSDAKVTVVEFSDFQCPYCESFYTRTYAKLKQNYGDKIRFVFRHYPLYQIHPDAMSSANASECAKEQGKFWEYHDLLFSNQANLSRDALIKYATTAKVENIDQFTQCLDTKKYQSVVDSDQLAGDGYFVTGTPTFFVNGNILVGSQPYEAFVAAIEKELKATGG
jgi:protein-disulfide isomerase